jgi:diguanylate cyclase (GGDEF)-like protein
MVGRRFVELIHPDDAPDLVALLSELTARPNRPASVDARARHREGTWHAVEIIGADLRSDEAVGGFVLNTRDVSERKALENQLRHQAFHDSLTNLANRASFFDRLEHALERSRRSRASLGVLFLDMDDFKAVNDSFGHEAGDDLLLEVARRIQSCLRPGDTAARLGGDEFGALLEDLTMADEAGAIARRLVESLKRPYRVAGKEITLSASIGVAVNPGAQTTANELVRNADIAMYEVKRSGGGGHAYYTADMYAVTLDRLELLADLQRAAANNEFEVRYQPTVELRSGRVLGFEALVRWQHPRRGLLGPGAFIGLAEESTVILPLGRWVLLEACRQAKAWQTRYPMDPLLTMNVNVSVHQIEHPSFVGHVIEALQTSGLDPSSLILEVTESAMLANTNSMVERLTELKTLGLRLAIDDFGTGYSSLSYLGHFPFDILKIDKAFIETDGDPSQRDVARAIIDLGKTLQLEVVAEGIERDDQRESLQAMNCEIGQGFLFSEPLQADEVDGLMRQKPGASEAA